MLYSDSPYERGRRINRLFRTESSRNSLTMRKNILSISLVAAVAALLFACGGNNSDILCRNTISNEEMYSVAYETVIRLLADDDVAEFLEKYNEEREKNPALSKRPIIKLAKTRNETDDKNLNTDPFSDTLLTCLMDSRLFSVTKYEGADRISEIVKSRDIIDDVNVNEATVMREGTIQAARLVLNSKIVSDKTRNGQTTVVSRFFVVDLIDIKTGLTLFKYIAEIAIADARGGAKRQ